jgi:alpha-1,3-rhamnosyltransferase
MKLVSVVVLAYCSQDTIVQTLDSVIKQTYKDIELIITDDFSSDNTVEITRKWIEENKGTLVNIELVTAEKNTGIPGNINRAFKKVEGEYVKLIAADDYMDENAIYEYVKFCDENPMSIPVAKVHLFSDNEAYLENIQKYCYKCYTFAQKPYNEQYKMLLKQNMIVAPSGSFYPTEIIRKLGGYDEYYRWFEDYPMNLRVMKKGYKFGLVDKELVFYRIAGNSITASQQQRLKKTEAKLFFRQRFWDMLQVGMIHEALGQTKYWVKVLLRK